MSLSHLDFHFIRQPEGFIRHTQKVDSLPLCRFWAELPYNVWPETGDEGRAVAPFPGNALSD